jgi:hypothetical protein
LKTDMGRSAPTSLAILIAAYPGLDEEVAFDPRTADDDPFESAAEIRFLTQSLRLAIRRHRRLARRAAEQSAPTAEAQRAR